jgi:hypothetical protein
MAELKTKPTRDSVSAFIAKVSDEQRRKDCKIIIELMREATKAKPEMWGSSIVGFGRCKYKYPSGRELEWMLVGFSPRKNDLTLYITSGFQSSPKLMAKLGKYKTGKSCLYVKRLADIDLNALRELIKESVEKIQNSKETAN